MSRLTAATTPAARTGVVVVKYGSPDDTLDLLDSLERSDDLDLDIVVVDNGPDFGDQEQLADLVAGRGSVLFPRENLGFAGGTNLGIRHVLERGSEQVWLLNPDTVVEPDTLGVLTEHVKATPDCGIVGPRLVLPGVPSRIWFDGGLVDEDGVGTTGHVGLGELEDEAPDPVARDVGYVTGAALLARRSTVEQIGPIPEHYFLYFEEVDWCVRARRGGWRVMVEPRARMVHKKRSSSDLPEPYYLYYMVRNRHVFAESCLGIDPDRSMEDFEKAFITPWREKVAVRAPAWLEQFDTLVQMARDDAQSGRWGRNDVITAYPAAKETHERTEV